MKKILPLVCEKCKYAVQRLQDRFPYNDAVPVERRDKWCGECIRREEIRNKRMMRG